jgi:hypothetical protein
VQRERQQTGARRVAREQEKHEQKHEQQYELSTTAKPVVEEDMAEEAGGVRLNPFIGD